MKSISTLLIGCMVGCFGDSASRELERSDEELDGIALRAVAGRQAIAPGSLTLTAAVTARYPNVGKVVREYKTLNQRDGTLHGVALDETGQEIDALAVQRSELAAREAAERRLEPSLAAHLASAKADDLVTIAIWLNEPAYQAPARPAPRAALSRATSDQLIAQVDERRSAFVKAVAQPFAARLRGQGFEVQEATHAPLVYATLPARAIEQLRASAEVDRMYLPVLAAPTLAPERNSIFAPTVNARGFTGAGVPVAAVEVGGRINTANPFLAGVTQDFLFSCASGHATAVAGIIRSTHPVERGVAPGANLWVGGSCSGSSAELQDRSTAAVNWGARALNLSFGANTGGVLTELDRYYDSVAINLFRTVIPAAGNDGNANFVLTPGTAYNVLTVGAYNELDNTIAGFSSGINPSSAHGDREKPDVAAPGVDFLSTIDVFPWIGNVFSGTSYAAPMTTGTAALMMQRNPSLMFWPEAVRAILMATALRNIEGAPRLSALDGAGGIFADFADDVARGVNGNWGGIGYDCSAAPSTVVGTMSLVAGRRTRAVISYDSDPSYASYGTQPSADLDLIIRNASGVVASSASWDNTNEIVDFIAPTTGAYTIEVSRFRCDMSPRWLGFAWFSL